MRVAFMNALLLSGPSGQSRFAVPHLSNSPFKPVNECLEASPTGPLPVSGHLERKARLGDTFDAFSIKNKL